MVMLSRNGRAVRPGKSARAGGDKRGNSYARRMRKAWMLAHFGTGKTCACVHCAEILDFDTIEADRIIPGGSYRRSNIQPSCGTCNKKRSNNPDWKGSRHEALDL